MTKLIPILSVRCLVVELPEGATKPIGLWTIEPNRLFYVDKNGCDTNISLPPGNWRIIGLLSEVTNAELADVTGFYYNKYNERYVEMPTSAMRATPIGDVEDAILAEGFTFQNNLRNPDDVCYFSRDRMIADVREYHEVQSRVLDRSRCLLLGSDAESPDIDYEKEMPHKQWPSTKYVARKVDAEPHDHDISDDYWRKRCEAAERYINESPCDPDITPAQEAAYEAWQEIVKQEPK